MKEDPHGHGVTGRGEKGGDRGMGGQTTMGKVTVIYDLHSGTSERKSGAISNRSGAKGVDRDCLWRPRMHERSPIRGRHGCVWALCEGRCVAHRSPEGVTAARRVPMALVQVLSCRTVGGSGYTGSQRLPDTRFPMAPSLRNAAEEMQEGAPGSETEEPAQQAGTGRPQYLPQEDG